MLRFSTACLVRCLIGCLAALSSPLGFAEIIAGKPTVFITGSNRGIGLEFVNQYSARGYNVIATARKPSSADDLNELARDRNNITVEQLDVTDHLRIDALALKYQNQAIDILINNAAITPKYLSAFRSVDGVDFDMSKRSLEVNAIAPLRIAKAFMPHVAASKQKKMLVISSKAGSFAESPKQAMMYSYRGSKAALNMYMYTLSFETPKKGIILTLLSPGMVNTMGILGKLLPGNQAPEVSVARMLAIIDELKPEHNGKMLSQEDGSVVPW